MEVDLIIIFPHLYFDWPCEVANIDVEGDVGIALETEFLTRETVSVLFNIVLGHNGNLFPGDGSRC